MASVVVLIAGLAAAWIAAGSTGLLGHPLRKTLTLVALSIAIGVRHPNLRTGSIIRTLPLFLAAGVAVFMVTLPLPAVNVLAAALVLASLALAAKGQSRSILLAASTAVVTLGLYRFAVTSVPWLCQAADLTGKGIGKMAALITGKPLWVGSTFAGLDMLVLSGAFWCLYLPGTRPPRAARAAYGCLGILGGHLVYLTALSYVPDLLAAVPVQQTETAWSWTALLHKVVPWNAPIIACVIHALTVATMVRWSTCSERVLTVAEPPDGDSLDDDSRPERPAPRSAALLSRLGLGTAALAMAVVLPVMAVLWPGSADLTGKKIVFYEKGFLNWLVPTHGSYGRLSSGMYGMLPVFVESLGAECLISADLSEDDLEGADALVLLFPDEPWQEGQRERIGDFVRAGGSLLVMGEHTTRDDEGENRFNEILSSTAMHVRFDSATFAVGGWLHSYETLAHPATVGIGDERNQFGVVIGASVQARWPARPLLIGRWGWTDDGDEANSGAMMGNGLYDCGEKLGDVVLAAEQPVGKGRIVTFGDTSGLTNAINVGSHTFNTRLFAYLAGNAARAYPAWRQIMAIVGGALLVVLLCRRPGIWKTSLVALGLAGSLVACTAANEDSIGALPDGRPNTPNNLAYIDASHAEANSSESWRPDGIGGLVLTLMRNGYLTLALPELTPQRLSRAGLLVSVAPSRTFSQRQIDAVKAFVHDGGTFIIMAGYERMAASAPLLDAFGFRVGIAADKALEPEPMGHFKAPYLESDGKRVYVRFHAAWPVTCIHPDARVLAYGKNDRPVIVRRRVGAGSVVLIGDTGFAMNKNLEHENGAAFEGLRENADFWRWFLSLLREEELWVPPALRREPAGEVPS